MNSLNGKIALVTGASKGIGAAIAVALASAGASVTVNYSSDKVGADRVVAAIKEAGGNALALGGDVSIRANVQALVDQTVSHFGSLDILVNNAGVYEFAALSEITEEAFHRGFNINVLGLLMVTQATVPVMNRGGSIINIGSVASRITTPASAVYAGTKGAVDAITGVLAKELGTNAIRVNSINPGFTATEGSKGFVESDFAKQLIARTSLGRAGTPNDIASVAVFLASDAAGWITGELISISGGLS